ncbi:hypothetical protein YC2023_066538 [Brassica napus]
MSAWRVLELSVRSVVVTGSRRALLSITCRKSLDSDDENAQGVGSKGLKHLVSSRVMSSNDTEFANKLNAKRTTSTRAATEFDTGTAHYTISSFDRLFQ